MRPIIYPFTTHQRDLELNLGRYVKIKTCISNISLLVIGKIPEHLMKYGNRSRFWCNSATARSHATKAKVTRRRQFVSFDYYDLGMKGYRVIPFTCYVVFLFHKLLSIPRDKLKITFKKIMHSSRMRTARLCIVPGCWGGGGWPLTLAGGGGEVVDLDPGQGGVVDKLKVTFKNKNNQLIWVILEHYRCFVKKFEPLVKWTCIFWNPVVHTEINSPHF